MRIIDIKNSPVGTEEKRREERLSTHEYMGESNYSQSVCVALNGDLPELLERKITGLIFNLRYERGAAKYQEIESLLSLLYQAYEEVRHD